MTIENTTAVETTTATTPAIELPTKLSGLMMCYRIPHDVKYPNPSGILRRFAFRIDGSVWVMPQQAEPHSLINDLRTKAKATVRVVKFDADEGPTLIRAAIEQMREEVEEQRKRTAAQIEKARERYLEEGGADAALAGNIEDREATLKAFILRAKANLASLESLLEDVQEAAKAFGINPDALSLGDTQAAFAALQVGVDARVKAYVTATQALRELKTADGTALADAAAKDQVPAGVMADALREAGNEIAADQLQAAFFPETKAEATAEPAEDDTFSLVGVGEEGV